MTNKEWLVTLPSEKWWETVEWLFHDYGRCYTDTRSAVIEWLNKSHMETVCDSCENFTKDQSEYHLCHMCEMEHSCYVENSKYDDGH